jgi:hypothetical protein
MILGGWGGEPQWRISSSPVTTSVKDLGCFSANDAVFPAVAPAQSFSRNEHGLLVFDDSADENMLFEGLMSEDYNGGDITVNVHWVAASAVVGDVKWNIAFESLAPGGQDVDTTGFAAAQTATSTTNGTSGVITKTSVTFTNVQAGLISAGNPMRLRVTRDADDVGDTMVGDAQVLRVALEQ